MGGGVPHDGKAGSEKGQASVEARITPNGASRLLMKPSLISSGKGPYYYQAETVHQRGATGLPGLSIGSEVW